MRHFLFKFTSYCIVLLHKLKVSMERMKTSIDCIATSDSTGAQLEIELDWHNGGEDAPKNFRKNSEILRASFDQIRGMNLFVRRINNIIAVMFS